MPTLADVIAAMEDRYPPTLASDWDAVGLVVGDPQATVSTVLFAVDPVPVVVDQALMENVDLIITHHPLFLHGVHGVGRDTAKGRMVHDLIAHGIALYTAHTNADHATDGVSDALAGALGVVNVRPIDPIDTVTGTGRIGDLQTPSTLADFVTLVGSALPPTPIRFAGDPNQSIRTVAVCGGAGDSLLGLIAGADVYVTADLRHHRAQDHLVSGGCPLIDISHWASEWPWLARAARALEADFTDAGLRTIVSDIPTDPWHGGGHV